MIIPTGSSPWCRSRGRTRVETAPPAPPLPGPGWLQARQSTGDAELAHWSAQHQGLDHETRAALRRDIDRNPEQRRGGQSAPWPGLAEVAANLEIPTLVVLGNADDVVSPTEPLRYYAELPVPRRHLHVLHGIGHYPNAQAPEALSALLAQFQGERCAAT